jgi:hypothetical protein
MRIGGSHGWDSVAGIFQEDRRMHPCFVLRDLGVMREILAGTIFDSRKEVYPATVRSLLDDQCDACMMRTNNANEHSLLTL